MSKGVVFAVLLAGGLAAGLGSTPRPARAQQFSAELISTASGGSMGGAAKLYVADRKVRIETPELPGDVLIVDASIPAAYLLRPAQRIFMDSKQSSRLTRLFVPLDPADPCRQWQVMAEIAGISDSGRWRCLAEGNERVDGRSTIKFAVRSLRGRGIAWIDANLKFPVKIETDDGTVLALKDIEEGLQPAEKFAIPGSYRKFDPRGVIEQMKRSDIWVEPPVAPDTRAR